jgi:uncharacterized SAM-binding protein YcdF (DUF218 family)
VLIITSAFHSRRALRTFRTSFAGTGIIVGLDPSSGLRTSAALWWLSPSGWRDVAGEYIKLVYYWSKYG